MSKQVTRSERPKAGVLHRTELVCGAYAVVVSTIKSRNARNGAGYETMAFPATASTGGAVTITSHHAIDERMAGSAETARDIHEEMIAEITALLAAGETFKREVGA